MKSEARVGEGLNRLARAAVLPLLDKQGLKTRGAAAARYVLPVEVYHPLGGDPPG